MDYTIPHTTLKHAISTMYIMLTFFLLWIDKMKLSKEKN